MKKVLSITMALVMMLSVAVVFTGCGGGDVLNGTWVQQNDDYGEMTLTFDGKGKCTLSSDYLKTDGTYEISEDGKQVVVDYESWENPVTFDFTVSDTTLNMQDVKKICAVDGDFTKK